MDKIVKLNQSNIHFVMGPHLSKVRREELEEHQEQAMLQGKEVEDWLTSPAKKSK